MAKVTISKRTVDDAAPAAKPYFLWDERLVGFGLKVTPAGGKVYIFQYRRAHPGEAAATTPTRLTIGKHGALTPEQARKRAQELAVMVASGVDPRQLRYDEKTAAEAIKAAAVTAEKEAGELAFETLADRWLVDYATRPMLRKARVRRPGSVEQARIAMRAHLKPAFECKRVDTITAVDIKRMLEATAGEASKRTVYAYLSVFLSWCEGEGLLSENPIRTVVKPAGSEARDRVLNDEELRAIWAASYDIGHPWGALYRLLMITGQRRGEVAGMSWAELDRAAKEWALPSLRTKNGVPHVVPLCALAIEELDKLAGKSTWPRKGLVLTTSGTVPVSGFAKAKRALDTAIKKRREGEPLTGWRPHDFRRTFATRLQKLGVRFEVILAAMNHHGGANKLGVAGVYQRHEWEPEKVKAMRRWGAALTPIVAAKPGEGFPIKSRTKAAA